LYINQFFIFITFKELFKSKELRSDLIEEWWDSHFISERNFVNTLKKIWFLFYLIAKTTEIC